MGTLRAYFLSEKNVETPDLYKEVRAAVFALPTGKNYQVIVTFLTWQWGTWGEIIRSEDFRIQERTVKHFPASYLQEAASIIMGLGQFNASKLQAGLQEQQS